ncbi:MAG: NADH-quinone oxidoreductase subunit J [Candidatus Heimdallarchaeota archaeon]|nr:NADH-quinone oxidoreductase subunit J [Candidatus Heimdallarchaeota archaeon]
MSLTVWISIVMVLAILAAVFAIESKNLMIAVISLIVMNFAIWIILLIFEATLLAWIQLIVYGGGLTALFVVVVSLTENQKDETFDWKRTTIALAVVAIIVALLIWVVASHNDGNITIVGVPSQFPASIWENRVTDIILQAVLFLATSIAIGVLFLQHKKKHKEVTKS